MKNQDITQLQMDALKGDTYSQLLLGNTYFNGDGVLINKAEAIKWYLEAAAQGNVDAQCCLGRIYESGDGVCQDIDEAVRWLRLAADQDSDEARNMLGVIGIGIPDGYYSPKGDSMTFYGRFHDNINAEEDALDTGGELDVDDLDGRVVTVEQLVGRNFYHYTGCKMDTEQPASYTLSGIDLDESEDENEHENDGEEDDNSDKSDGLDNYLLEDCWIKRFVDDNDPNICYLLYLSLAKDGRIEDSGCIVESSQRMGSGGFFIMIPGMEFMSVKTYDYESCPPDKVIDDLLLIFKGRTLPLDFSFKGKRLPQAMIDAGGNGGSTREYTYALQSAYRLAYMHMSIETDENGVIESFSYSSYQSSGSCYGDLFSRPNSYGDKREEAMDMLLYIYDHYTDDEINALKQ